MITLSPHNPKLEALLDAMPAGLKRHAATVQEKALELAAIHGVDSAKAEIASTAHDVARAMKEADLIERAEAYGLPVVRNIDPANRAPGNNEPPTLQPDPNDPEPPRNVPSVPDRRGNAACPAP